MNINDSSAARKPEDLLIRTKRFAIDTALFLKKQKVTIYNDHIIKQLLRSSSSIGANFCEAKESITRKDFVNKTAISKKESQETMYWLDLLVADLGEVPEIKRLHDEARQFVMIFVSMIRK
ncbi:MAG: four helix bundle protein [bacterium]